MFRVESTRRPFWILNPPEGPLGSESRGPHSTGDPNVSPGLAGSSTAWPPIHSIFGLKIHNNRVTVENGFIFQCPPLETGLGTELSINSVTHRISSVVIHAQAPRIRAGSSFGFRLSCPPPALAGKGCKANCARSHPARSWSLQEPQPQAPRHRGPLPAPPPPSRDLGASVMSPGAAVHTPSPSASSKRE